MKSLRTILKFLATALLMVAIILMWQMAWRKEALPVEPTLVPHFNVTIPQKALLKNYVDISVAAPAGTACKLTFIPASGETQEMDTIANAVGLCEWRWKLEESNGKGAARLIFTINGLSDTHFIQVFADF